MESKEQAKIEILKGVNRKIRRRGIRIATISVIICLIIGSIAYFLLFVKQTPIEAKSFREVSIETKLETIQQLDTKELSYNHLKFTVDHNIWYSLTESNAHFYVENNDDENTATLYFYISESYMQKKKGEKINEEMLKSLEQSIEETKHNETEKYDQEQTERLRQELSSEDKSNTWDMLLTPSICKTNNGHINEITKVYYLVYDYDNMKQEQFNQVKETATLLWEK